MQSVENVVRHLTEQVPPLGEHPSRVQKNSVCFVDMSDSKYEDVIRDGNGKYHNSGRWAWVLDSNNKLGKKQQIFDRKTLKHDQKMVVKTYYTHAKYRDFKRETIYISSKHVEYVNSAMIVIYHFSGEEHEIIPNPHGNSHKSHGFTAVKKSIIRNIKEKTMHMSNREALETHIREQGGRANIAIEKLPNEHHLKSASSKRKASFFSDVVQWTEDNPHICRLVTLHPEPVIVLATEQHPKDLECFHCHDNSEPITIDPTFNLGNFYVTPITYRNSLLKAKRYPNNSASFCGPLLIHFHKTYAAYEALFTTLKKACPSLSSLRAYGTDGEGELIKALKEAFPSAHHLRCFMHIEKNLLSSIKGLGVVNAVKESLHTLCQCNHDEFHEVFTSILKKFENIPKLSDYLLKNKEILLNNVHASNNNGKLFYTNPSESINEKIKKYMMYKPSELFSFLLSIVKFFQAEEGSAEDAYLDRSQTYSLVSEIPSIGNIFNKTPAEKDNFLKNLKTLTDVPSKTAAVVNSCRESPLHPPVDFSVTPHSCNIGINIAVLTMMFDKAARLVLDNGILRAPSRDKSILAFSALSNFSLKNHLVIIHQSGNISCDCNAHKTNKICSHSIAAGHMGECLYDFIKYLRRFTCNSGPTSEIITQTIDKTYSGMKPNQRKRVRLQASTGLVNTKIMSCPVDHETPGLIKFVLLKNHPSVSRCYGCNKKNLNEFASALST